MDMVWGWAVPVPGGRGRHTPTVVHEDVLRAAHVRECPVPRQVAANAALAAVRPS